MKRFVDNYGTVGLITDNGVTRVLPYFDNGKLEYVNIVTHNGKKVSISTKTLLEVIEMLETYTKQPYIGNDL